MKFLAVFAALVAVAASHSTWTLPQLSEAIQNPNTDPGLLPFLEHALNEIMESLYSGNQVESATVTIPAVDLSSWTLAQLSDAIQDPSTDPALIPYLTQALNTLMEAIVSETPVAVGPIAIPAMDVTAWSLHELSEAIENPATNPELLPYLQHALNEMMTAIFAGEQMDVIAVVTPAGLQPIVEVAPIEPSPVDAPAVPAPVETPVSSPAAPASPLVQIIVNINQQQQVEPVAPISPVIVPEHVVEEAAVVPTPVQVVEQAPVVPTPVQVVEQAPVEPTPVGVVEQPPYVPMPIHVINS